MTHDEVVRDINEIRNRYRSVVKFLRNQETIPSFGTLLQTTPIVKDAFDRAIVVAENPRVANKCLGMMNCAVIGSSSAGKTTMMEGMFPSLAKQGLLYADVTDTTSQALHISLARSKEDLADVFVESWSNAQLRRLMNDDDVKLQNETDNIQVNYEKDYLVVDGSGSTLKNIQSFRFGTKVELHPFPHSYRVSREQLGDQGFIQSLTVKKTSEKLNQDTVLTIEGRSYNSAQLRAVVKEVRLKDTYDNIIRWSNRTREQASRLQFVDTPGISVASNEKDEILRHFLGKKSNHLALQMWLDDDLDIIVHVVMCASKSDFAELWKTIAKHSDQAQLDDLSERLVLVVNGTNKYFHETSFLRAYEGDQNSQRDGDHFSTSIVDNILMTMSPRGRVKPARICFVDSKPHVEALAKRSYAEYYKDCEPTMLRWAQPGNVGHSTLSDLGIVDSFKENIAALVDPDDQGKGFLVRQLFELADEKGPYLLIKKYLLRTKIVSEIENLLDVVTTFYDDSGTLTRKAILAALNSCLTFIAKGDSQSLERFASDRLDPIVDGINFGDAKNYPRDWGKRAFSQMAEQIREAILNESKPLQIIADEFRRHFNSQIANWSSRWGYDVFAIPPPGISAPNSADLMRYCLRLHAREVMMRLLAEQETNGDCDGFQQTKEDRRDILQIIAWLREAKAMTEKLCVTNGVKL